MLLLAVMSVCLSLFSLLSVFGFTEHVRSSHRDIIPGAGVLHERADEQPPRPGQAPEGGEDGDARRPHGDGGGPEPDAIPEGHHQGVHAHPPAGAVPPAALLHPRLRDQRLHHPRRHARHRQRVGARQGPDVLGQGRGVLPGALPGTRPRRRGRHVRQGHPVRAVRGWAQDLRGGHVRHRHRRDHAREPHLPFRLGDARRDGAHRGQGGHVRSVRDDASPDAETLPCS
uniref:Secreted protein n=1 Tax=Zea mays TaxID=4577 RepID=C0HJA0_MAIZE|nr:unknown [Zea mays]